jgi:hypothetical protein
MDCRLERKEVGKRGGKGTGGTQTKGPELGELKTGATTGSIHPPRRLPASGSRFKEANEYREKWMEGDGT